MAEFLEFQRTFHHGRSPGRDSKSPNMSFEKQGGKVNNKQLHMMLLGHTLPKGERKEVALTDFIASVSNNYVNGLAEK